MSKKILPFYKDKIVMSWEKTALPTNVREPVQSMPIFCFKVILCKSCQAAILYQY